MTVDAPQNDDSVKEPESGKDEQPQPSGSASAPSPPSNYQKKEKRFSTTLHDFAAIGPSELNTSTGTHQPFQDMPVSIETVPDNGQISSTATGDIPVYAEGGQVISGTDPAISQADPRTSGTNPAISQADPRTSGTNPAISQADPRTSGTNPALTPADSQTTGAISAFPSAFPSSPDTVAPVDAVDYEFEDDIGEISDEEYILQDEESSAVAQYIDDGYGIPDQSSDSPEPVYTPPELTVGITEQARPERNLASSIAAKNKKKEVKSALSQALERDKAWLEKKDQPTERMALDAQLLARNAEQTDAPDISTSQQISRTSFAGTIAQTAKEAPKPSLFETTIDAIAKNPIPLGAAVVIMIASILFVNLQSLQAASKLVQQGSDLLAHGDTKGAIASLDKAVQLNGAAVDAYMFRGKAYSRQGNAEKALRDYKEVLRRDSKNIDALEQCADISLSQEQYQTAVNYYQDYLKYAGQNVAVGVYEGLGHAYLELQQFPLALDFLNRAVNSSEGGGEARMLRARCFLRMNKPSDALQDAVAAVKLEPNSYQAFVLRGKANQLAGNKENALSDFNTAVTLASKNSSSYISRANFFASQKDFPNALRDFGKALSLNPKNPEIYEQRAKCYVDQGDTTKAEQDLQTVASMPDFHPSLAFTLSRADIYKRGGEYEKAIEFLKKAQSKDSKHEAEYLLHIADCYAALKEYGKAAAACVKVLALQPKNADAVLKHGQYSYLAGNKMTGQSDLFKAIELAPSNPNAYLQRGNYYMAEKQYTAASDDFKKALALDPDLAAAKDNLELCSVQLKHAKTSGGSSATTSEPDLGVTKAERKEIAELDTKALQTKGYEALKAGRNQYAVAAFTQAVKLSPNLAVLRRYLAAALVSVEDGASAVEQFKAWMKLEHVALSDQINFAKTLAAANDADHAKAIFASIIAGTTEPADLLNIASTCAALHFDELAKTAIEKGLQTAVEPVRAQLVQLQASLGKSGQTSAPIPDVDYVPDRRN